MRILKTVFLVTIIAILTLITAEVVFRMFFIESTRVADASPYEEPDWGNKYLEKNSDGFRDEEHELEKKEGVFRIAFIGDSYTFGWRINNPRDRYSDIVEEKMNFVLGEDRGNRGWRVETLNYSSPGLGTKEEKAIYDKFVRKYSPDFVVLGILPNDILVDKEMLDTERLGFMSGIFNTSYLCEYVFTLYAGYYFKSRRWKKPYLEKIRESFRNRGNLDRFTRDILDFRRACEADNAGFMVLLFPVFLDFQDYPLKEENGIMAGILSKNEIDYLDVFPLFENTDTLEYTVNEYDPHPNEKAHAVIAGAFMEKSAGLVLIEDGSVRGGSHHENSPGIR